MVVLLEFLILRDDLPSSETVLQSKSIPALPHLRVSLSPSAQKMAGKFAAVAFASALVHYVSASACVPSATLSAGTVYGAHCSQAPNALAFRGIPYAQRPVGHLRFEPPRPYSGSYSDGHLNATTNPPSCIQFGEAFKDAGPTSEDWWA